MDPVKNSQFVKTSSSSTKLLFEHRGRPVVPLCERRIGEHMSTGRKWISGMYGTKTGIILFFEVHGIGCFKGFFVEPGLRIRWICKVGKGVQAMNRRIYELVKVFVAPFDLELPYADATGPHKEYDPGFGGKQALGDEEIGSSQKKVMEVRSRIFVLRIKGFAL